MNTKIYANDIKEDTLKQFREAMAQKCNIKGALMSDAHTGYTLAHRRSHPLKKCNISSICRL
ncbi:hypothetical protein [Campylobacter hyointestinalis]|uniref:hypothetical protein n=1 Tax=Campylobacter hyointestinalis TaxID=198 RepID=UPI0007C8BDD6|nr:hypothetical protein [Campylobacter hyointestinalis]